MLLTQKTLCLIDSRAMFVFYSLVFPVVQVIFSKILGFLKTKTVDILTGNYTVPGLFSNNN